MVVVSDTSPIRALQALDLVTLLEQLYGSVLVPPAVAEELREPAAVIGAFEVERYPFVQVQTPADAAFVAGLPGALGLGEAQAIALALEVGADMLLVDERVGRAAAQRLGLRTLGVLGMREGEGGRAHRAGGAAHGQAGTPDRLSDLTGAAGAGAERRRGAIGALVPGLACGASEAALTRLNP